MAVIYTDSKGTGYDLEGLKSAYASGAFNGSALDSRVPDILSSYGGSSAPAAPANNPGITSDFPGTGGLTLQAPPPTPTSTTPGGTGSEATTFTPQPMPDYSSYPLMGAAPIDANTIAGLYTKYLGPTRTISPEEMYYASGHPGGAAALEDFIKNSPEAAAYALSSQARQKTIGPATTIQQPKPGGNGGAAANPTTTYSNDPNASLLINTVLSRLAQLRQPLDTTAQDAYIKQALDRVGQLSGAPFTDTQSAALLTQNMEPLTQARDQAKQQAAEQMSRRGITPTSGVFVDAMNKIDQAYERGVANVTNTLNVKGIDQNTQNQNAKLAIMNSIVDMTRATQMQQEGLSSQLVPTAATLTNLDSSRLSALLSASSSGDPSGLIGALTGVGNLGLNNQNLQNQQSAASSAALAQLIYSLMNGSAGLLH